MPQLNSGEKLIVVSLTAAQINALDATISGSNEVGLSLLSFTSGQGTNSRIVRVPKRLELSLGAGTAYSLTLSQTGQYAPDSNEDSDNLVSGYRKGAYLELYESKAAGTSRVWFKIPLRGFLDQALAQTRIAFPNLNGVSLDPTAKGWYLRTSCPIASGTGLLTLRLYYDEYGVDN